MAHDNCLAKCPKNCDCIIDDIKELKRIKNISTKTLNNILEQYLTWIYREEDLCPVINISMLPDIVRDIKELIGE